MTLYRCSQCGSVVALQHGEMRGSDGRTCGQVQMAEFDGEQRFSICRGKLQELTTSVGLVR